MHTLYKTEPVFGRERQEAARELYDVETGHNFSMAAAHLGYAGIPNIFTLLEIPIHNTEDVWMREDMLHEASLSFPLAESRMRHLVLAVETYTSF
jgi:hypothetical protein